MWVLGQRLASAAHLSTETFRSLSFSNRMPGTFRTHIPNRASAADRRDSRCEYRVK
jgi:hypothetical protein